MFYHAIVCLIYFLELSSTFDDIYDLYINDPGDHNLVNDEEDAVDIQSIADFLHDIIDN